MFGERLLDFLGFKKQQAFSKVLANYVSKEKANRRHRRRNKK